MERPLFYTIFEHNALQYNLLDLYGAIYFFCTKSNLDHVDLRRLAESNILLPFDIVVVYVVISGSDSTQNYIILIPH